MRKIAVVLILVIAIGAAAPFGMGYMAERQINRIANRLSERPQVTVTVKDYKRGYMNSTATLHIDYKAVQPEKQQDVIQASVELKQTIKHGPFLSTADGFRFGMAYAESDLVLSKEAKAVLNEIFKDQASQPEFVIDSMIHLNGASEHHFRIPQYKFLHKDNTQDDITITTSGAHGSWEMSSDLDYHTGTLNFGSFLLQQDKVLARINAPEITFDMNHNNIGIYTGKTRIDFPSFEVSVDGKMEYQLKSLELNTSGDVDKDLYHVSFNGGFENLKLEQKAYGPLLFNVSLRNLDANAIVEIQKLADQMQDPNTPKEQQQAIVLGLMTKVPEVFSRGAELRIEPFNLSLPQGKVEIAGHLKIDEGSLTGIAANPFAALQKLNGELKVVMAKDVARELMVKESRDKIAKMEAYSRLRQAQQANYAHMNNGQQPPEHKPLTAQEIEAKSQSMADSYIKSLKDNGYVTEEGKNFVMNAKMEKGVLTVNGKRMPNQMLGAF